MSAQFLEVIEQLGFLDQGLPHKSNLVTKLKSATLSEEQAEAAGRIIQEYLKLSEVFNQTDVELKVWLQNSAEAVDEYIRFLSDVNNKKFSHQSDLISSVVPELFYYLFKKYVIQNNPDMTVDAQKNIIIDVEFVPTKSKVMSLKRKRVDIAILMPCSLVINNEEVSNFSLPVLAAEIKTNLDKNMISGIEHSVESFKKAFPLSKYFVLAELADFDYRKQNYASSHIDELYILRKQARSTYRRSGALEGLDLGLLNEIAERAIDYIGDINKETSTLAARMAKGKLIKGTIYDD